MGKKTETMGCSGINAETGGPWSMGCTRVREIPFSYTHVQTIRNMRLSLCAASTYLFWEVPLKCDRVPVEARRAAERGDPKRNL